MTFDVMTWSCLSAQILSSPHISDPLQDRETHNGPVKEPQFDVNNAKPLFFVPDSNKA